MSDSFDGEDACLEFTATMININLGHNGELMNKCRVLGEYATFIAKIREYQNQGLTVADAIDRASMYCIDHDILKQFLLKNRSEVVKVLLTEFDEKKYIRMERRDAYEDGVREGTEIGYNQGIERGMEQGIEQGMERGEYVHK